MKDENSSQHTKDVTDANERIYNRKLKMFEHVHPNDACCGKTDTRRSQLPVHQQVFEKSPRKGKFFHAHHGQLQENLAGCQQKTVYGGNNN